MAGERGEREETPDDGSTAGADMETEPLDTREDGRDDWPPFLRHGLFTVAVYVVAVSAMLLLSEGDLQGPALVTFSIGFSVFMLFYFVAMYVAWLFMD